MKTIVSRARVIALFSILTLGTNLGFERAEAQSKKPLGGGFTQPIHVNSSSHTNESSATNTLNRSGLSDHQHSTEASDAWHSPSPSAHPVQPNRSNHWIQYDLGQAYALGRTHFWNLNEPGQTQNGFRWMTIDYSTDGTTWNRLATFELPQAPGRSNYRGTEGPDFKRASVRYVLFTALSNWGGTTHSGLAEIQIEHADAPLPIISNPSPTPILSVAKSHGLDLDGDGMSDAWEAYHQADSLNPSSDEDGDQQTNLE